MAEEEQETPAEALAWEITTALGRISQAESMQDCPYYGMGGVCRSGCYSEPSCMTDEPIGGWAEDARAARAYLAALLASALEPGALLSGEAR